MGGFHAIGIKYKLTENFNGIDCVVLNYDNQFSFYLAKKNPFKEGDSRYYDYIPIGEDGIKVQPNQHKKRYKILKKIGISINDKEILQIKNVIFNIK